MSDNPHLSAGSTRADDAYDVLLTDLRAIIASGRGRAVASVNKVWFLP